MAKAPAVRKVAAVEKSLQGSIQPQLGLLDESIASNANAGAAQELGLQAKQKESFGQIEQGAQDKGMFFSGFSPDEQAKYTSTTYLPALAQLQQTIAQTRSDLLGKKADLRTGIFNKAFDSVEQDRAVLADWNKMTAQQRFDASQAAKDRAFKAKEGEKDRAAAAANAARSGGGSSGADVLSADTKGVAKDLSSMTGDDGYVSPGTWKTLRNQWKGAGYSTKTFDANFGQFKNPKNPYYK